MSGLRRFVYIAQRFACVLLPAWLIVSPGCFRPGWTGVFMVFVAPIVIVALALLAIVCVSIRSNRQARTAPALFAVCSLVLWCAMIVVGLALSGATDGDAYASTLSLIGLPADASDAVGASAIIVVIVGWVASLVAVIVARPARQPHSVQD